MYIDKSKLECNVIPEGKKFLAYVGIGKGTDRKRIKARGEAGSLFELFYQKTTPLHVVAIGITGFSKSFDKGVLLQNGKSSQEKIYSGSHFRHRISHKSCVSSFPYNSSNLAGVLYAKV